MGQLFATPEPVASDSTTTTSLLGLMQHSELMVSSLLLHAERNHPEVQIVSRRVEGDIHRCTYKDIARRCRQVANALRGLHLQPGDRVATLAWNGYRHLETYFAASGAQFVLHTLNPRLAPEQFVWICNHAEDKVLLFDATFLPLVQKVWKSCHTIQYFVLLCEEKDFPKEQSSIPDLYCYESWIQKQSEEFVWPVFDERTAAALCYTSGTTGDPKGVLYSHRSTVLHCISSAQPDLLNLSSRDSILAVVPMFHVNAWGLPYASAMVGAKLVFPGPAMDGKSIYDLVESEQVNFAAGVPTIWQMLLTYCTQEGKKFSTLNRTVVGGSACPPSMLLQFQNEFNVRVVHAWGMTETSPLGSVCALKHAQLQLPSEEQVQIQLKQGRAPFLVEMKILDRESGQELPWDGKQGGDLLVKGPWVVERYFKQPQSCVNAEGYFATGDVATVDEFGFMTITDRSKDVVKSGGEWISSIEIENVAMAHPHVAMAACVGMKHPKWDERPIVVVVKRNAVSVTREEILEFFEGKVAKWQIPDDVVFVDAIPLGATGKMQKSKIREMLHDYVLPELRKAAAGEQ